MAQKQRATGSASIDSALANARQRFVRQMAHRTVELFKAFEKLRQSSCDQEREAVCLDVRAKIHKLHGLAAMVGFPRIGSLASVLENHIDLVVAGPRPIETDFVVELLEELLTEMLDELEPDKSGD